MATAPPTKSQDTKKAIPPLPQPNTDFYDVYETLIPEELALLKQVRAFLDTKVAPIINKYWGEDSFPFELLPALKELNIAGIGLKGYWCRSRSVPLFGLSASELSLVSASFPQY